MGHTVPGDTTAGPAGMQHEGMTMPSDGAMPGMPQGGMQMDGAMMQRMMEMHMRMLQDPVIRERIATDPAGRTAREIDALR